MPLSFFIMFIIAVINITKIWLNFGVESVMKFSFLTLEYVYGEFVFVNSGLVRWPIMYGVRAVPVFRRQTQNSRGPILISNYHLERYTHSYPGLRYTKKSDTMHLYCYEP